MQSLVMRWRVVSLQVMPERMRLFEPILRCFSIENKFLQKVELV